MKWLLAVLVALLIGLQLRLWLGGGSVFDLRRLHEAIEAQRAENDSLEERNRQLQAEVMDLKGGYEAIEERARNELGMVRKGETFHLVIEE
jgi:cell division protein FtsB